MATKLTISDAIGSQLACRRPTSYHPNHCRDGRGCLQAYSRPRSVRCRASVLISSADLPRRGHPRGIEHAAWNFFEARILTLT